MFCLENCVGVFDEHRTIYKYLLSKQINSNHLHSDNELWRLYQAPPIFFVNPLFPARHATLLATLRKAKWSWLPLAFLMMFVRRSSQ